MKASLLIAASLLAGTAAFAQSTDTTTPAANQATAPEGPNTPSQTTESSATPDHSVGGTGASSSGMAAPSADTSAAASTDTSSYPSCSRTVHDKCVQRGGRPHR
jgi:hypothetical protein